MFVFSGATPRKREQSFKSGKRPGQLYISPPFTSYVVCTYNVYVSDLAWPFTSAAQKERVKFFNCSYFRGLFHENANN